MKKGLISMASGAILGIASMLNVGCQIDYESRRQDPFLEHRMILDGKFWLDNPHLFLQYPQDSAAPAFPLDNNSMNLQNHTLQEPISEQQKIGYILETQVYGK